MVRIRALSIFQMLAGLFIQVSALHVFGMDKMVPNLFVAALIPSALLFGPIYGLLSGYLGGLIIDILTGYGLGLSAIPFAIGGFIAGILSEYINSEHYLSSVIFVVITLFLYDIFMFMSLYFSRSVIVINIDLVFQSLVVVLMSCAVTVVDHIWINKRHEIHQRRRRMNSGFGS